MSATDFNLNIDVLEFQTGSFKIPMQSSVLILFDSYICQLNKRQSVIIYHIKIQLGNNLQYILILTNN